MKNIFTLMLLAALIIGGWWIYANSRGVQVELTDASTGTAAAAAAKVSADNPNLSRATVNGQDMLVLKAKVSIRNKEDKSATVTFLNLGQVLKKTTLTGRNGVKTEPFLAYGLFSGVRKVAIWDIDQGESAKLETMQVIVPAKTTKTYMIEISVLVKDLPEGQYAMTLHENTGGYTTDVGNTRNVWPISEKKSNSVKIDASTGSGNGGTGNTGGSNGGTGIGGTGIVTGNITPPNRTRTFDFPVTGSVLKKGQTYAAKLSGYTDDINFSTEKVILNRAVNGNPAYLRALGFFNPTTKTYSFTVPTDLPAGQYMLTINGALVLKSQVFTIAE